MQTNQSCSIDTFEAISLRKNRDVNNFYSLCDFFHILIFQTSLTSATNKSIFILFYVTVINA